MFDNEIAIVTIKDHILESVCSCNLKKFQAMASSSKMRTNIKEIGKTKKTLEEKIITENKDDVCQVSVLRILIYKLI